MVTTLLVLDPSTMFLFVLSFLGDGSTITLATTFTLSVRSNLVVDFFYVFSHIIEPILNYLEKVLNYLEKCLWSLWNSSHDLLPVISDYSVALVFPLAF